MDRIIKNINNWLIFDILRDRNGNSFFEVIPDPEKLSDEEIDELSEKRWVLKYMKGFRKEVEIILEHNMHKNKLFIPMPSIEKCKYNILSKDSWFVMEKCDGTINEVIDITKNNLNKLISYMIDVFCWIHLELNKVHGDIKIDNILYKYRGEDVDFYLIDYENFNIPNETTCQQNLPNGYYYYYLGCNNDESYTSYRMDLEAFGTILIQIFLSELKLFTFEWQMKARMFYNRKEKNDNFDYLNSLKFYELGHSVRKITNNYIVKYLQIIKEQPWDADKPDPKVYNKLKNLFVE